MLLNSLDSSNFQLLLGVCYFSLNYACCLSTEVHLVLNIDPKSSMLMLLGFLSGKSEKNSVVSTSFNSFTFLFCLILHGSSV